jgi:hypothetical protein
MPHLACAMLAANVANRAKTHSRRGEMLKLREVIARIARRLWATAANKRCRNIMSNYGRVTSRVHALLSGRRSKEDSLQR